MVAKWLGHTTVLLQWGETTILTDPVFSTRIGVSLGPLTIGMKRLRPPAMDLSSIPRPDLILLSHAHFDHFDIPSLRALESKGTTVVTAAKTADLLRRGRYAAVHELGWGEWRQIGPVRVEAFPVKHWGARMQTDRYRGFNGYTIEAEGRRVIFGGDTALTDTFRPLKSSRPWNLAIMPIGAYNPWIYAHCTPEEALRMADDAGAEHVLPVHHQTFALSREPLMEPISRFQTAVGRDLHRVAATAIGDEFRF
jgi:L-ascorbate metabolism protein UlaG (beta-lactamase superfamily)